MFCSSDSFCGLLKLSLGQLETAGTIKGPKEGPESLSHDNCDQIYWLTGGITALRRQEDCCEFEVQDEIFSQQNSWLWWGEEGLIPARWPRKLVAVE